MSINVVSVPKKTVAGGDSKWSAVHQPISFEMQRKDINVVSIVDDGSGNMKCNTNDDISEMAVGQTVYVNCGGYEGSYEVTAFSNVVPQYFILDAPFVSVAISGYANLITARPNYYVETRIMGVNAVGSYYEVSTSINKPNTAGLAKVNVSTFLKSMVAYVNSFPYNVRNKADLTQGGRFNIQYRECWTGTTGSYSALSSTLLYYFVNAAKQIQQVNGSNMGEYVTFPTTNTAKFMSDFDKPTYWPGFPFSLSFIWSDMMVGYALEKFEKQLNVNGGVVSTLDFNLDNSQGLKVNRLMLEGGYPNSTKTLQTWLEAEPGGCVDYVNDDYVTDDYTVEVCGLPVVVFTGER